MSNSFVVIPFRRDLQQVTRSLILRGLGEHWGSIDESLNPDLSDIAESYGTGHFVVAYAGSELVGTGGYRPTSSTTIEVQRMSVRREFRRNGVASLILEDLISHAHTNGYSRAILETTATWNDAVSFYEEFGFVKLGVRDGEMHFERKI